MVEQEMKTIYEIAKELHYEYERQATYYQWNTQKQCRVDFDDLPEQNKKVMLAIATHVYNMMIEVRIQELKDFTADKDYQQFSLAKERITELQNIKAK